MQTSAALQWRLSTAPEPTKPCDPKDYNGYLTQKVAKLTRETNQIEDSLLQQDSKGQQLQRDLQEATSLGEQLQKIGSDLRAKVRNLTTDTDRSSARCERLQREVKLRSGEVEEQLRGTSAEKALLEDAAEHAAAVRESLHGLKEQHSHEEDRNDVAYRCLKADIWSVQRMLNASKVEKDTLDTRASELRQALKLTGAEREKLEFDVKACTAEIREQERVNRELTIKVQQVGCEVETARHAVDSRVNEVYHLHTATRHSSANTHRLKEFTQRKANELQALRTEVLGALTDIQDRQDALQDKIGSLRVRSSSSCCDRSCGSTSSAGAGAGAFHRRSGSCNPFLAASGAALDDDFEPQDPTPLALASTVLREATHPEAHLAQVDHQ